MLNVVSDQLARQNIVHMNLGQETIVITEDKVWRTLTTHHQKMEARNAWIAPGGMLLTIIVTLLTTDFHSLFGLSKDVWQALFIMGAILSAIWLLHCVAKGFHAPTVDDVVQEMKAISLTPPGPTAPTH